MSAHLSRQDAALLVARRFVQWSLAGYPLTAWHPAEAAPDAPLPATPRSGPPSRLVRAIKPWTCAACGKAIVIGQTYALRRVRVPCRRPRGAIAYKWAWQHYCNNDGCQDRQEVTR